MPLRNVLLRSGQGLNARRKSVRFRERLWLFFLPLMFLPDLGFRRPTAFGTLEVGDYLILPYIVLLLVAKGQACPRYTKGLRYVLVAFLAWGLVGTMTINVRYAYGFDYHTMFFSFFKMAKLALYVIAGILTMNRVKGSSGRREFYWSLLGVIAVLGISILLGPEKGLEDRSVMGYISVNPVSVTAAVLVTFCGGLLVCGYGSKLWKRAAVLILLLALAGIFVSETRGAWLAMILALPYVVWRRGFRTHTIVLVVGLLIASYSSYLLFPKFRQKFDFTVSPELRYQTGETMNVAGIDEGGRPVIWLEEGPKFADAPVFGTGFFHRGGLSPLWVSGSHNFFLQMFLETGFLGGILILCIFGRMWLEAGSRDARQALLTVPFRAALIAAMVGGMSGEYYYGGIPVLALFLVYAPTGALPAIRRARVVSRLDWMARQPVAEKGHAWVR
jgi:O-antigen ligase